MSDIFDPADPNRQRPFPPDQNPADATAGQGASGQGAPQGDAAGYTDTSAGQAGAGQGADGAGGDPFGAQRPDEPPRADFAPGDYGPEALRGDYRSRSEQFRQGAEEAATRVRGAAEKAQEQTRARLDTARGVIAESGDRAVALASYGLALVFGLTIGASAVVAALLSWAKQDTADAFHASHFRFQIRTFWLGLAGLLGCLILTLIWIGWPLMLALAVWWTLRQVVGLVRLLEGRPIADPKTWLI